MERESAREDREEAGGRQAGRQAGRQTHRRIKTDMGGADTQGGVQTHRQRHLAASPSLARDATR